MTSLKVGGGANYYAGYRGLSRIHLQRTRTVLPTKRRSKVGINIPAALNLPFSEWTTVFPNPRLCKALLDRVTDRAHIIETGTESFRFRRTGERGKKR